MKSKKAQSLPMNTIIIAIIAIVVLVIIIVFFIGGTSSIAQRIRSLFTGAISGTDLTTATQFCNEYCQQGRNTAWCSHTFYIDKDAPFDDAPDKIDDKYVNYYCGTNHEYTTNTPIGDLGITCSQITCQ